MTIRIFKPIVTGMFVVAIGAANAFGQSDQSSQAPSTTVYIADSTAAPQTEEAQSKDDGKSTGEYSISDSSCDNDCNGPGNCECCPLNCPEQDVTRLFDCCRIRQCGASLTGWVNGGIMLNGHNPDSHFNGPVTYTDRDEGQLDQLYMVYEKTADANNCGWFLGGRVDYSWGNDYFFTTASGLDGTKRGNLARWNDDDSFRYGSSLPQLYAEVDYNDLKVKVGHFYGPFGYESAQAPNNFFATHSYAFQYAEPMTLTGVLASKPINDCWSWSAGVVGGWSDWDSNSNAQFLGGLTYTVKDKGSVAAYIISGDDSTIFVPNIGPFANRTMGSLVWTANLSSRMTYVLETDMGEQEDAATLQGTDRAEWYGLTQYLFYKLNCCWTAGARFEVFRDDDGFNVTGLRPGNPLVGNFFAGNFYETAIGLNYKPNGNLTVRPEIRYDSFHPSSSNIGSQDPFNDNTSKNQFLYGIDATIRF